MLHRQQQCLCVERGSSAPYCTFRPLIAMGHQLHLLCMASSPSLCLHGQISMGCWPVQHGDCEHSKGDFWGQKSETATCSFRPSPANFMRAPLYLSQHTCVGCSHYNLGHTDCSALTQWLLKACIARLQVQMRMRLAKKTVQKLAFALAAASHAAPDEQLAQDEDIVCIVCLDQPLNVVFHPCSQCVTCSACARLVLQAQQPCPLCRSPIASQVAAEQLPQS